MPETAAQVAVSKDGDERSGPDRNLIVGLRRRLTTHARFERLPRQSQESLLIVDGHLVWLPAHQIAAAIYPTTEVLSPDTSPESAYSSTRADDAPRRRAASSTATIGPPPHA